MSEKELRFIDPTSFTVMNTSINVVFAIIISIIAIIVSAITNIGMIIMLVPAIIFGTLIIEIFNNFSSIFLYNLLIKKLNCIKIEITEEGEITKISPVSTSLIIALIVIIISIIFYLVSFAFIPTLLLGILYSLMSSGQIINAMIIGQLVTPFINAIMTPMIVVIAIIIVFISVFIAMLIQIALYNLLTEKIGGAIVDLKTENGTTSLEAINPIKTATIFTVTNIVVSVIFGAIQAILTNDFFGLINDVIGGAVGAFVGILIFAVSYNILSKKLGTIKVELI